MLESALKTYKPDPSIFPQCLHKILFMVPTEEFWRVDGKIGVARLVCDCDSSFNFTVLVNEVYNIGEG